MAPSTIFHPRLRAPLTTIALCCAAAMIGPLLAAPAAAKQDAEPVEPYCGDLIGETVCIATANYVPDVCAAIEIYSDHYDLPAGFFARLIWQESRFDPNAISPVGAQGIAQFMPSTASLRDLSDPFDPAEALARSAQYLSFLELKFGNLGLAAAAYNGGEGRISGLVAGTGGAAAETRNFVSIITGQPLDYWLGDPQPVDFVLHPELPFRDACADMAARIPIPTMRAETGGWQPWGVLIAQNFSADIARAAFVRTSTRYPDLFDGRQLLFITGRNLSLGTRLRYSAQVGFPSRDEAQHFCAALNSAGGNCIVQRNQ